MASNRIREVRKAKGFTLQAVADGTGISTSYLSRLESGEREVDLSHVRAIAATLGVSAGELVDAPTTTVPIMGYVGAGAVIEPEFEQTPPEGLDDVQISFPVPDGVIGFRVRGDSMLPRFRDRDVLLVFAEQRLETRAYLGEEVIVRTGDGRRFVKTLLRGPEPGTFNLESHNARTIESVRLAWVGEIYAIVPGKQVADYERMKKAAATRRAKTRARETKGMDELPLSRRSS